MARAPTAEALTASPLFKNLSPAEISRLAEFCRYRELGPAEVLFHEGDEAAAFYVVASGQIKVYKQSVDGRELIIKIMREGDMVGEAAALAGIPYPASAQTLEAGAAVEVPRGDFVRALREEPELALNIIAALSKRLHQLSAVIEKLTLQEVPARLASYLLEHAATEADGPAHVELDVSKAALAAELGTVPETLSRALRRLQEAGMVTSEGRRLYLLDEPSLRLIAGHPRP